MNSVAGNFFRAFPASLVYNASPGTWPPYLAVGLRRADLRSIWYCNLPESNFGYFLVAKWLIQSMKTANKDNIYKDSNYESSSNIMSESLISDDENDSIMSDSSISDEESEYEFTNPSQVTNNYNYNVRKKYRSELDKLGIPLQMSKTRSGKVNN